MWVRVEDYELGTSEKPERRSAVMLYIGRRYFMTGGPPHWTYFHDVVGLPPERAKEVRRLVARQFQSQKKRRARYFRKQKP